MWLKWYLVVYLQAFLLDAQSLVNIDLCISLPFNCLTLLWCLLHNSVRSFTNTNGQQWNFALIDLHLPNLLITLHYLYQQFSLSFIRTNLWCWVCSCHNFLLNWLHHKITIPKYKQIRLFRKVNLILRAVPKPFLYASHKCKVVGEGFVDRSGAGFGKPKPCLHASHICLVVKRHLHTVWVSGLWSGLWAERGVPKPFLYASHGS